MANDSATLTVGTSDARLRFDWIRYDGDDGFDQHTIEYTDLDGTLHFSFGACAIRCVRKIESLLDCEVDSIGFGFRVPEIIYYDLTRSGDSLHLHVHSVELAINAKMVVKMTEPVFEKPFREFNKTSR